MCAVAAAPGTSSSAGPYIGLTNFSEENASLFFGRDAERKVLISNLRASRLTLLHAESGVGKSSLLRAGVAARLRAFALRGLDEDAGPGNIPVVFSSWRDDPTGDLIGEIPKSVASLVPAAASATAGLKRLEKTLRAASEATGATLLVILDQFEEYFLYRMRERPHGRFVDELSDCINALDLRANFLIAIREDAYAGLGDLFQGRIDNIYGNFLRLENLTRRTAREAIERPIDRYNLEHPDQPPVELDPRLVDEVLDQLRPDQFASDETGKGKLGAAEDDGAGDDIPPPYLQLVMQRLWEEDAAQVLHRLKLETLQRLGGAATIVRTHVERALSGLPQADREAAFDIFRHLVTPSGSKIALGPSDLAEYSTKSVPELERLLERLAASDTRILRPVPPPQRSNSGNRYEITHDLLAPAILDWRTRERNLRLEREKHEAEQRVHAERRRARRFRGLAIGCAALLVAAVALAILVLSFASSAREHERVAESRRLAASAEAVVGHDPELATLLALQALRARPVTAEATNALRDALPRMQLRATLAPPVPFRSVEFSQDGKRILAASANGSLWVWDAGTHELVASLPKVGASNDAALSRDGRRIVTAENDGTAQILDVASGRVLGTLTPARGSALTSAAFSPDGLSVATAAADGIARVWDVATAKETAHSTVERDHVLMSVAFSPDGRRIIGASASSRAVVFDAATGKTVAQIADSSGLLSAAFSPDGRHVVTGGGAWAPGIWRSADGHREATLTPAGDAGMNFGVSYSRDGRRIVAAGGDGVTRIWDVRRRKVVHALGRRGTDTVIAAAFSPDGRTVATASAGGALRLWDAGTGRQTAALPVPGGGDALRSATLSADGRMAATASRFGAVTIWKRSRAVASRAWTPALVIGMPEGDGVADVAFNATGELLATANQSGRWYVWSVANGDLVETAYDALRPLNSVEFHPTDPNRFVTASDDGYARIYDLPSDVPVGEAFGVSRWKLHTAHFSADGRSVVTASDDGTRIWDVRTHKQAMATLDPGDVAYDAAIRPDGKQVVYGADSGLSYLYDVEPRRYVGQIDRSRPDKISAVSFSGDGRLLVTAGSDATARIWDVDNQSQLLTLVGHGGPIRSAEFSREGSELLTASADGTAKLWDAAPIEQRAVLHGTSGTGVYTAWFSPAGDGKVAAASQDGVVRVFDAGNPTAERMRLGKAREDYASASAQFSRDGKLLVTTDGFAKVMVWSVADPDKPLASIDTSRFRRCSNPSSSVSPSLYGATFSSSGTLVVTANADGTACTWDWRTHTLVRRFRAPGGTTAGATGATGVADNSMRWAVFSTDDRQVLTANDDGTARIWDASRDDRWVRVFAMPTGDAVNAAWYSPDGRRVITASSDGTARIWNVDDGTLERVLADPDRSEVYNATYGPDGRYVITCSGAVRIWSATTGEQRTQFRYGDTLSDCEFSPDGKQIVTGGTDGHTRVFSTELVGSVDQLKRLAEQRVTRPLTARERRTFRVGAG